MPAHFAILIDADGCVIGSAYPEYVRELARDIKPFQRIETVDRAEWTARAEPCLKNQCQHREAS